MDQLVYKKATTIYKVLNEYFSPMYAKELPAPLLPPENSYLPLPAPRPEPQIIQYPVITYLPSPAPVIINNPQPIIIREQPSHSSQIYGGSNNIAIGTTQKKKKED